LIIISELYGYQHIKVISNYPTNLTDKQRRILPKEFGHGQSEYSYYRKWKLEGICSLFYSRNTNKWLPVEIIGLPNLFLQATDKDGFFSFKEVGFQRTDSIIYTSLSATVFIKNQPLIVRILLGHFADNHIN